MASGKKNSRMNIVYTSIYSLMGGFGLEALMSFFANESEPLYTLPLKVGGVLGIAYYFWHLSKFDRLFINLGLGIDNVFPLQKSVRYHDKSTVYKFTLPTGLDVEQIKNKQGAIEQWLGKKVMIEYINKGLFIIEVFNDNSVQMYNFDETIEVDGEIAFPAGYDIHGKLITGCLSNLDDNNNMMVASTTGGGKSIFLRGLITYLIIKKKIDMYLIDLKGTEFPVFENCSCVKKACYDPKGVVLLLQEIINEMQRRYTLFRQKSERGNSIRDIKAYNSKYKANKLNHILVAIDEFSLLMDDEDAQKLLIHISSLGRAAGISVIISTQRPDAKIIDSRIKCNFSVITGLKTNSAVNSRVVIDDDSLSKLRGKGHMVFRYGGKDYELQDMFIRDSQLEELIKPFEVNKIKEVDKQKENNINEQYNVDIIDMEAFH